MQESLTDIVFFVYILRCETEFCRMQYSLALHVYQTISMDQELLMTPKFSPPKKNSSYEVLYEFASHGDVHPVPVGLTAENPGSSMAMIENVVRFCT